MRIAIYSRVSTDGQDATNQLRQLRQHCEAQGWQIVQEYVDVASGGRADREQLQAMLRDAGKRRFEAVLVWALDRLTREGPLAALTYLQRLSSVGVKFTSYSEPYISTIGPLGDGIIALLSCFAKMEKDRLRERTLAGLARAKAQGRVGGRPKSLRDHHRAEIAALRESGATFKQIAEKFGVCELTIRRTLA
ncbi:MAG TPA: recombinase family protein [Terriglobales bacterium]|nr:recombinase family protein [Terriglobales bacterium]